MALILPPTRPTQLVRASFGNPLARGLAALYMYETHGAFRDSVTGKIGTANANQSIANSQEGRVLQYNGSAQVGYTNFTNPNSVLASSCTIIARLRLTAKPGGNAVAAGYVSNYSTGRGPIVGFNSSGNIIGGAVSSSGLSVVADGVDHTGQWVTVGGMPLNTGGQLYINGIYKGINFSGTTAGGPAPVGVYLGRDNSPYFGTFTGQIAWVAAWNRLLSAAEHMAVVRNPYGLLATQPDRRAYNISGGGTAYTLAATAGSYLISGDSANVASARKLGVSPGSYSVTGTAALLAAQRKLGAAPGSYSINGAATSLVAARKLSLSPGVYTINGAAAQTGAQRKLAAAAGSYFVTGQAINTIVIRHYVLPAAAGSYFIQGSGANLTYSGAPLNVSDTQYYRRRKFKR